MEREYTQLRRSLVESGEWDQLQSVMRAQLNDVGWVDDVKNMTKEMRCDFDSLLEQVSRHAHSSLPAVLRKDMVAMIRGQLDTSSSRRHTRGKM
ncbi:SAGA histone acetylase and TREX-2 complexes component [Leucoagaricus gongylophorus]